MQWDVGCVVLCGVFCVVMGVHGWCIVRDSEGGGDRIRVKVSMV